MAGSRVTKIAALAIIAAFTILASTSIPLEPHSLLGVYSALAKAHGYTPTQGEDARARQVLQRIVERDSKLLSYREFYSFYVAGRVVEIDARRVPQLIGVNPRYLHILAYEGGRWVEVPIKVFSKCFEVGAKQVYCLTPSKISVDTKILVKVPPELPRLPVKAVANSILGVLGFVEKAYAISLRVVVGGRVYVVSYLAVVSRIPNKWVLENEYRDLNVENDFDAWGLAKTVARLRHLASMHLLPASLLSRVLRVYAETPLEPLSIEVKPLSVAKAKQLALESESGRIFVIETASPLKSWGAKGVPPLEIEAVYRILPEGSLSKYVIGNPVTQSITLSIAITRIEGYNPATVSVEMLCGSEVVDSRSYVVYEDYARLKPTFYWPPCNTVRFKIELWGSGEWSASIVGLSIVHIVDAKAIEGSKLRKELRLYVLGSPFDRGPTTFITLPRGIDRGSYAGFLAIPFNLALVNGEYFDGSKVETLSMRITNAGSVGAYVTLCFAGECSDRIFVNPHSTRVVSMRIWATSINSYTWYLQPVPVFIDVEKAHSGGVAIIEIQPLNYLDLFARPVLPIYPELSGQYYTVTTLLSDEYSDAWDNFQEFRGGIDFVAMGYVGKHGGFVSVFEWFSTNRECSRVGCQLYLEVAILFAGATTEDATPYEVTKLAVTLLGKWVGSGMPTALRFNEGSNLPKAFEIPPPLSMGTAFIASLTIPEVEWVIGAFELASWLWNQAIKYAKNVVDIDVSSDRVTYVWSHGPLAPPVTTMFFEVADYGPFIPSNVNEIGVSTHVVGAQLYGPYEPLDTHLNGSIRVVVLSG